jgi:hypothetical protein
MESREILSVDLEVKNLIQAYENRRDFLEQDSGFTQDEARTQVLKLSNALIEELSLLSDRIKGGALDT